MGGHVFKDEVLDSLAARGANVAQFVSFGPDLKQRFSRIRFDEGNACSIERAVEHVLTSSVARSVNVRSYQPESPKSREFLYGLRSVEQASEQVRRLCRQGLYTIVNETIDVSDGGVSGVIHGETIEFAPDDTPRCVEKPGTAALSRSAGIKLLNTVYGFQPDLSFDPEWRVEFSIHPRRRGIKNGHTIIWETESQNFPAGAPRVVWPNRFSKMIGDKTFGLLVAWTAGLRVPKTTVISRRIAPFSFGQPSGTGEFWIRTAPMVQQPGLFATIETWVDPFRLTNDEDPNGDQIAAVLSQEYVASRTAGAFSWVKDGNSEAVLVEGVNGNGDEFMKGNRPPDKLSSSVIQSVTKIASLCRKRLGLCRGEWVFDGTLVWLVQLHRLAEVMEPQVIVPGSASSFRPFVVTDGLEALRKLVNSMSSTDEGIELIGEVGITSHFGDVLRQARIPSRFAATT